MAVELDTTITGYSGGLEHRYVYSGFGRTLDQVNNSSNSPASRFTSQAFDEDTGLCYYESRYYDPELGRFIQPDTIYPDLFDPQMLNRYSYVGNNPISYTDPTGHVNAHFFLSSSGASSARHSSLLSGPANASSQSTFSLFFQNVRANWWGDTRGFLRGVGNAGIGLAQTAGSFLSNPVGFTNQVAARLAGAGRGFMADPRGFTNNIMEAAYASATTSEGIGGITFGALTAIAGGGLLKEIGTVGRVTRLTEKVDLPDAPSTSTQAAKVYFPDAPSTQAAEGIPPVNVLPSSGNKFVVDPKGNVIPVKPGETLTGSPNGKWIQVRDANGNPTGMRLDGGHKPSTHPDPRAQVPHAHVPGVTNRDGSPWLPVNQ